MKKWILGIIVVSILSALFTGCVSVGAVGLPVDSNNNDKQTDNIPQDTTEDKEKDQINTDNKENTNLDKDATEEVKVEDNNLQGSEGSNEEKDSVEEPEEVPAKKPNDVEPKIHYSGDSNKNLIALSFDDGPDSTYTSQILDILNEYDIKATFFVLGERVEKYPEILKSIHENGHEVGNHSWSHKYFPKLSKEGMKKEVSMTEKIIVETIGEYSPVFRPPYGALNNPGKELISSLGYNIVNWSVDTRDWAGTPSDQMMKYVKQQLKPGGIILMHNSGNVNSLKNTVEILPTIIEWAKEQGYEFTTVSEVLDF